MSIFILLGEIMTTKQKIVAVILVALYAIGLTFLYMATALSTFINYISNVLT